MRILWVVGLAVGLFVLDRALLWMESRGWIYYRRTRPGRGDNLNRSLFLV